MGQEVFTDVFAGQAPISLLTIDDQLYVSTFGAGNGQETGIFRVDFDNPDSFEVVAEFPTSGAGLLYMAYDPDTNSIFAPLALPGDPIIRLDLNQSLPITPEILLEESGTSINNGFIYDNGFIYYYNFMMDSIRRISTSGGSAETVFNIPDANNLVISQIFNNQLYYTRVSDDTGSDLYRIDISNPVETLVSDLDGITVFQQSSYLNEDKLFMGFEALGSIISLDLSSSIPIQPEIVTDNTQIGVLGITSYLDDIFYTTGAQNVFRLEDGLLSTSDFENNNLSVYPNPMQNQLFLTSASQEPMRYEVYDVLGKNVLNGEYVDSGIDVSQLVNGMYFVRIATGNGFVHTEKVLKN
jgi:hypothetical protein